MKPGRPGKDCLTQLLPAAVGGAAVRAAAAAGQHSALCILGCSLLLPWGRKPAWQGLQGPVCSSSVARCFSFNHKATEVIRLSIMARNQAKGRRAKKWCAALQRQHLV